ncbi:MAG TPA: FAD/NAD(P)-binding protein [Streptosporangiaceae bacterium]|nr:FAD/NAD(P)-binding protein [Streptosporangiaceae bacterium]
MTSPWRVLQVGCGPSGVSLLRQLLPRLAQAGTEVRLDVCDPAEAGPGPGLAFSTPYDLHLLNVRADLMSLDADDKGEFARWRAGLAGRPPGGAGPSTGGAAAGRDDEDYPPRRLFGDYARTVLADTLRTARAAGQRVEVSAERAVALWPAGAGTWRCRFASGRSAAYQTVILALGHLPSRRYSPAEGGPSFFASPWGELAVDSAHTVGIVGTRLTGIDAALALRERGHVGPIVMASRSGRLPSIKGRVAPAELRVLPRFVRGHDTGTATLRQVAEVIGQEIEYAEERPIDWTAALHPPPTTTAELRRGLEAVDAPWQAVLFAIVRWVPELWRILNPPGRDLFMSSYLSLWAGRIASFPAITARRLLTMMDSGQLTVRGGLTAIEPAGGRHRMRFADGGPLGADVVINATGPGFGPDSLAANPVTAHLLRTGVVVPHRHGGIAVDLHTLEVTDARGRPRRGLHAIGDLTRGEFLATNAVENTVRQSVQLAEVLTRQLARPAGRTARP